MQLSILAAPAASFAGTLLITGGTLNLQALITLGSLLITACVITGISLMRFLTTRYRITGDRIELRSGLLFRSHRSIRLDRIRGVDLTANPVHRVFGLTSVRIGTGDQTSSSSRRLSLDGVSKAQAPNCGSGSSAAATPPPATPPTRTTTPSPTSTGPGSATHP